MWAIFQISVIFTVLLQISAYSKYGRSCKDIGCLNSEVCVMAEDPCSYYNRDQCGSYPTCQSTGSNKSPSCVNYACPPTQICHLDDGTPKCVPSKTSSSHATNQENTNNQNPSYPAQNPSYPAQNPSYPHNPSAPVLPAGAGGSLYPSLTTSRPAGHGYPSSGGNGYAGSAPNSGYPGSGGSSGYPSNNGYPSQGGYPSNNGYPSQSGYPGHPSQGSGYPSQSGGYPGQRYPQPQYPQGQYPGYSSNSHGSSRQPGYQSQPTGNRYGLPSAANPIVDKITDQLKSIGTSLLKNALGLNKKT